jgi:hypothetical protein
MSMKSHRRAWQLNMPMNESSHNCSCYKHEKCTTRPRQMDLLFGQLRELIKKKRTFAVETYLVNLYNFFGK